MVFVAIGKAIVGAFTSGKKDKQIANLETEKARCEVSCLILHFSMHTNKILLTLQAQLASETKRMQEQEDQHKTMVNLISG